MVVEVVEALGKKLKIWIPKNVEKSFKEWYPESEKPWDFVILALTDREVLEAGEPLYAIGVGDTLYVLAKTGDRVTAWYYDPQFGGVVREGTYRDVDEFIEKQVLSKGLKWDDVLIEAIVIRC